MSGGYKVFFCPSARMEFMELPRRERIAMDTVIEKLKVMGPRLGHPHQSYVKGCRGLRELRPRAGRSTLRPLYHRLDARTFVILAIAPEAQADGRGFTNSTRDATRRLREITRDA